MSRPHLSTTRLINLIVFAFVVLMVIAEVPSTSLRLSKKKEIDEATELVCGRILLTRQKAVASRTRYRIHYDDTTGGWTTYHEVWPGRWLVEASNEGEIPQSVSIKLTSTPSSGYIEINANGAIENHGVPVVIRFVDGEGAQKSIRISPAGMVQETTTW